MRTNKRVLLIGDDLDLAEALRVVLASGEYTVSSAYSPEEGFIRALRERPDVIILDMIFDPAERPRGFDIAVRLKKEPGLDSIPLVVLTSVNSDRPGFDFSNTRLKEELPADAFLEKPAQLEALLDRLDRLCR